MSNPVPDLLALTSIADGSPRNAAPVRNNFSAIQTAVNALKTALAGGAAGQVLTSAGPDAVSWGTAPARIVRGRVQSDGSVLNGGGFSVNHSATGTYVITFAAFSQVPAVTCLPDGGASPFLAMGGAESASGVTIFITNPSGTLTDRAFYFTAIDTA